MVASPPGCNYCLVPVFKVSNFPHRIRPLLSAMSNQHQHTHTHRGESALICMEGEIVQVCSCGREGVMEVLMLTDHPDMSCCCICIFSAVLSPSDLFTVCVTVMTGTVSAHVHLRHCHFWLSYDDGDTWCGVQRCCFSTQFYTCILLGVSWEHLECVCRTPAVLIHLHNQSCRITLRHLCWNNKPLERNSIVFLFIQAGHAACSLGLTNRESVFWVPFWLSYCPL